MEEKELCDKLNLALSSDVLKLVEFALALSPEKFDRTIDFTWNTGSQVQICIVRRSGKKVAVDVDVPRSQKAVIEAIKKKKWPVPITSSTSTFVALEED